MIQIYLDSNPIDQIENQEETKEKIIDNQKPDDAIQGIIKNIYIKPIQIYQSNKKSKIRTYSDQSQSDSSSSSSSISKSLESISTSQQDKQQHDKSKTKILDFVLDSHPSKKDILIKYQVDGKQRTITNKLLTHRLQKIINQKLENKEEETIEKDGNVKNFKKNLQKELEIGLNRYYQKNYFNSCFRCKQIGHHENQCTEKLKIQCIYCLSQKHQGDTCNNVSCFRCNRKGHRKYDCKIKMRLTFCPHCGKTSHKAEDCGIIVPVQTKGNTQIICLSCKQYGHANCNIDNALQL